MKPNKLALLATTVAFAFAASACHRQQTESGGEVGPTPSTTQADTGAMTTNQPPAVRPTDTTAAGRDTTGMARDTTMGGMPRDTTMRDTTMRSDSTNKNPPTR
jgi:hypothetical protein